MEKRWRGAGKPLVPVNHLEGTACGFLEAHKAGRAAKLPGLLDCFGGHTVLYEVKAEDSNVQDSHALLRYPRWARRGTTQQGSVRQSGEVVGLGYPEGRFSIGWLRFQ